MKRLYVAMLAVALWAPHAVADDAPSATVEGKADAAAAVTAQGMPDASKAQEALAKVRERAKQASEKARAAVDKNLGETSAEVDAGASADGGGVASRLAEEFGVTADVLIEERTRFETGWGDLMIAHLLVTNAKTTLTIDQIYDLRKEGLGWGAIAHGLDLKLGQVVSAAKSQGKVALGTEKSDGKPARIAAGSNANANVAAKGAAAKAAGKADVSGAVGKGSAGVDVGAGAGVSVGKGGGNGKK